MYVKLYTKYAEFFRVLKDDEVGRLVLAMIDYAEGIKKPRLFGNERLLWPVVKWDIDHNDGDEPDNSDAPLRNAGQQCGG